MGCSCVGLASIITGALALCLAAIALGLPFWSTNDQSALEIPGLPGGASNETKVSKATFAAGVYGICTNVNFENQVQNITDGEVSSCYLYYTSKKVDRFSRQAINNNNKEVIIEQKISLCKEYNNAINGTVPPVEGIPPDVLDDFLDETCGPLGKASLASAVIATSLGVFMIIFLIFGVLCCGKKSFCVWLAGAAGVLAGCFSLFAFAIWIKQSTALRDLDDTGFSVSFFFAVIAAVFYWIAAVLAFKHVAKGREE